MIKINRPARPQVGADPVLAARAGDMVLPIGNGRGRSHRFPIFLPQAAARNEDREETGFLPSRKGALNACRMNARIAALCRYPVKGLSPQPHDTAALAAGDYFPGDRLFAVENGPSGFDPEAPAHQSKIRFLMLMRHERLAALRTRYDDAAGTLSIQADGREAVRADLASREGRLAVEAFLRRFMPKDLRGPPKLLTAPAGFRFTDSRRGFVSLLNLASVAALETAVGRPVHPLRFRANLYVEGWPAWGEFDLVGRELLIGPAVRLKVTKRIERCAATDVDPDTAQRDTAIPRTLMQSFGHTDCGVYAEVVAGGAIKTGDRISVLAERQAVLPF